MKRLHVDTGGKRHVLARRVLVLIVLFSSAVTLVLTGTQLYGEYRTDVRLIDERMEQIELSYLDSVRATLWIFDREQILVMLNGMLNLHDMQYIEIRKDNEILMSVGRPREENLISRDYPILHTYQGREILLGTLRAVATLDMVYERLWNRVWSILLGNGVKTFLVSLFILLIFQHLVARHLDKVARYVRDFDPEQPRAPLGLDRTPKRNRKSDELDHVVTAINDMQANLERSYGALRESEERLRLVTDALPVLISYVGKDGRYRFVNKAYEDWFGIPCEQVRGMHLKDLVGDDAYQAVGQRVEDVLSGQSVRYEAKLPFQHGGDRHIQGVYVPHFAENGGVDGFFALITDVTEQKKAETQLIRASRLATLGEMASGIAHELNQPLTNMRMMAENALAYVESADVDAAVQTRKLEGVIGQVDRMAGIVDHMRLFSRKDSAERETFSPTTCAADAIGMVENQYRALGIRLERDLPARCRNVSGHRFKLEQVILNLLSNARDAAVARADRAAREGSEFVPEVSVRVAEDRKTDTVILSVTDNGGGVPEDVLDEIFDPFFTTKAEGQGTGLGLSISYSIIDTMGGRIEVRNAEDGARFDVILPVADEVLPVADEAHPRLAAPKPQEQPPAAQERPHRLIRVLVVDDEEPTATNTAEYLEYAGYATATAGNGAEALKLFIANPFDVVVTDRRMPVMDGNQLIRRLRALDPDLPIIAMTGQDASDDGQTAPAAGNDGAAAGGASVVLRKPIRLSDLEGHVRRLTRA